MVGGLFYFVFKTINDVILNPRGEADIDVTVAQKFFDRAMETTQVHLPVPFFEFLPIQPHHR